MAAPRSSASDVFRYCVGAACVFLLATANGIAADLAGPSVATGNGVATGNDANALQEIVVTAERREENLNKVPISVAAFSRDTLDELHIQTVSDIASVVPGVVIPTPVSSSIAQTQVGIRGIFSGGNAPTTQFYIDETPVAIRQLNTAGSSGTPEPQIFDLDRVEVLRGPQGTLFGSSAMGGAIRFITPQPSVNDSSGFAKTDIGYTERGAPSYEVGAAYGAPIAAGTAGFRVSGWFQSAGGFNDMEDPYSGNILERNANSSESSVFRAAFTLIPTEGLTITPAVFIQHIHDDNPNTYWTDLLPNPENGAHVSGVTEQQPSNDDLRVSSLAVKYDFDGLSFRSDTSYLDREFNDIEDYTHATEFDFAGNPIIPGLSSFVNYENDIDFTHQWQQEFRLTSQDPGARLNWVTGAYYRHAVEGVEQLLPGDISSVTEACCQQTSLQLTGNPDYVLNGQVLNGYTNFQTTDVEEAVFGDITFSILPRLKADAGVRIAHSIVEHQTEIIAGPVDGTSYSSSVLPDETGTPVTPRISLTYQYTDQDMVYVSAAKGYRAGGGNGAEVESSRCDASVEAYGLKSASPTFGSDSLWSYEIGAKDSLFDRRLAIEASAYYIDWSNIQTTLGLPSCGLAFTANLGKAVSKGFDLQIAAIPLDGVKLSANVGYDDAYHPNAFFGAPSQGVAPLVNAAGDKLPNVLPWQASAHAEYSRDIGNVWSGARSYVRADYRWVSAAPTPNPDAAAYDDEVGLHQNPAYGVLNLRLGVLVQQLDLSAYVFNVTNSDPVLGYAHDNTNDPLFYASNIRPLTVGITAAYRF